MDPVNPDTPRLDTYGHIWSPFRGLFGDWVTKPPVIDGSVTRVTAYRHLPLPDWGHPLWVDSYMQQDIRFEAYDTVTIYTYYQTGNIPSTATGPFEEPDWENN